MKNKRLVRHWLLCQSLFMIVVAVVLSLGHAGLGVWLAVTAGITIGNAIGAYLCRDGGDSRS